MFNIEGPKKTGCRLKGVYPKKILHLAGLMNVPKLTYLDLSSSIHHRPSGAAIHALAASLVHLPELMHLDLMGNGMRDHLRVQVNGGRQALLARGSSADGGAVAVTEALLHMPALTNFMILGTGTCCFASDFPDEYTYEHYSEDDLDWEKDPDLDVHNCPVVLLEKAVQDAVKETGEERQRHLQSAVEQYKRAYASAKGGA